MYVREEIASVNVRQRSVNNRATQILTPSSVAEDICIESLELSVTVDSYLPSSQERVPLASCNDVLVTVQHAAHGSLGLLCSNGANRRKLNGSSLFPSKSPPKSFDF